MDKIKIKCLKVYRIRIYNLVLMCFIVKMNISKEAYKIFFLYIRV